mmetsp:Transcript_38540/g.106397  ORF Transcript_38540/g.106397 Transcript_38540/m.106397 type:complete len:302 (+) Transcript_38540:80-985(+)
MTSTCRRCACCRIFSRSARGGSCGWCSAALKGRCATSSPPRAFSSRLGTTRSSRSCRKLSSSARAFTRSARASTCPARAIYRPLSWVRLRRACRRHRHQMRPARRMASGRWARVARRNWQAGRRATCVVRGARRPSAGFSWRTSRLPIWARRWSRTSGRRVSSLPIRTSPSRLSLGQRDHRRLHLRRPRRADRAVHLRRSGGGLRRRGCVRGGHRPDGATRHAVQPHRARAADRPQPFAGSARHGAGVGDGGRARRCGGAARVGARGGSRRPLRRSCSASTHGVFLVFLGVPFVPTTHNTC